jgi:hypothetical protein
MRSRDLFRRLRGVLLLIAVASAASMRAPAQAAPWDGGRNTFISPRFERIWREADLAVQQGRTTRSWTWGPQPWFDYKEIYAQSPQGLRQVQYFDKARMEISQPADTGGLLGGVTNGLLTVELVSGRLKLGDGIGGDQNLQLVPSSVPVAGDLPALAGRSPVTPGYDSFGAVATVDNGYRDPNRLGQRVGATMGPHGEVGFDQILADRPGLEIVAYEPMTGHNIPRVFQDFLAASPIPAIAAFGYPITDSYWVTAEVGGLRQRVLVQLFERRTLTYTPGNPAAFQVEMGNVGQHYFAWRYPRIGKPWAVADAVRPITFASIIAGDAAGMGQIRLPEQTVDPVGGVDQSIIPASSLGYWEPDLPSWYRAVYGDTTAFNGRRQLAMLLPQAGFRNRLLTSASNDYEPAISPDGSQIAFVSDRDGNPELYLLWLLPYTTEAVQLTATEGCTSSHPEWLPDGSGLIYESTCLDGNFELYRAPLSYRVDVSGGQLAVAQTIGPGQVQVSRLTNSGSDERWPRISPNGRQIAFFSAQDGDTEIYVIPGEGGPQTQLTFNSARDEAPAWAPDGSKLAFNSNRDGDHEIFTMSLDGSAQTQLTYNTIDDGYAVWGP